MTTCNYVPGCVNEAEWCIVQGTEPEDLLDEPCCEAHKEDAVLTYGYEALYRIGVGPSEPLQQLWNVFLVVNLPYNARVRADTAEEAMQLAEHEVPTEALKDYAVLDGFDVEDLVIRAVGAMEV